MISSIFLIASLASLAASASLGDSCILGATSVCTVGQCSSQTLTCGGAEAFCQTNADCISGKCNNSVCDYKIGSTRPSGASKGLSGQNAPCGYSGYNATADSASSSGFDFELFNIYAPAEGERCGEVGSFCTSDVQCVAGTACGSNMRCVELVSTSSSASAASSITAGPTSTSSRTRNRGPSRLHTPSKTHKPSKSHTPTHKPSHKPSSKPKPSHSRSSSHPSASASNRKRTQITLRQSICPSEGNQVLSSCAVGKSFECVDLTTDLDHCGTCGNACGAGYGCENSQCKLLECAEGFAIVENECVQLM